jgi:hypothetical protein
VSVDSTAGTARVMSFLNASVCGPERDQRENHPGQSEIAGAGRFTALFSPCFTSHRATFYGRGEYREESWSSRFRVATELLARKGVRVMLGDFVECCPFSSKEQATSRKVARPYKIGEVLKSLLKLHR